MTQVKTGDTVHIHYTGTLNDGTTFDSSEGREPLTFEVGSGQIIPGLDSAIPGMTVGDKKTVNVACDDAYGQMNPACARMCLAQIFRRRFRWKLAHAFRCRPRTGK